MELLRRAVPGLAALASYERGWVTRDLVAGITVWAILVPQAMGYAALAGVPSVYGLYTAFGALLLYWLWAARGTTLSGCSWEPAWSSSWSGQHPQRGRYPCQASSSRS